MRIVPTTKTLTDPRRFHRQLYIWEPLLDGLYFPSRQVQMQELYYETVDKINETPVRTLDLERRYHSELAKRLHLLRGRIVVYTPGVSIDQGNPVKTIGMDPMSDRNKLSSSIQRLSRELYDEWRGNGEEFPLDMFVFVPAAPIIFPYRVNRNFEVEHYFSDAADIANDSARDRGKRTFGDLVKGLEAEFRVASWKFSPSLFDVSLAKMFWPEDDSEEIEKAVAFNRYVFANALARMIPQYTTPDERHPSGMINAFMKRGSYAFEVLDITQKILHKHGMDIKISDMGKVMRNTDFSREGECDPKALDILKGFESSVARSVV